jgi:hypothetical protein
MITAYLNNIEKHLAEHVRRAINSIVKVKEKLKQLRRERNLSKDEKRQRIRTILQKARNIKRYLLETQQGVECALQP